MPKSLTRDLIFFISGCFVLALIWPNLEYEFALYGVAIENGQWYRLFTVALVHGGWLHLLFNMLALFSLGTLIENFYGRNKYIIILLVSLLAGSLTSYLFNPPQIIAVGASGMIFGLFGALAIAGKSLGANLKEVGSLIAINIAIPVFIPGIDWKAHLGGLAGGLLTSALLRPKRGAWE
ncbi:MAG: rhomboid family intramembrane serine protease [Candidatus Nanopelagicus sp.]